jgi:hypothetical protein
LRLIAWITLVGAPILILLQAQVVFLPYHDPLTTWAQRLLLLVDLFVIWGFWDRIRSQDDPILGPVLSRFWPVVGLALSIAAFIFSAFVASFPGERLEVLTNIPYWGHCTNCSSQVQRMKSPPFYRECRLYGDTLE